jgi:hypothetical protein
MNIAKERKGLAYRIKGLPDDQATVEWLGEVETTADDAMNHTPGKPRRIIAAEWLTDMFREKRRWSSDDLFRAADEEHISRSAIFEAKKQLNLPKAKKIVSPGGKEEWFWWVPDDWPPLNIETESNEEPAVF